MEMRGKKDFLLSVYQNEKGEGRRKKDISFLISSLFDLEKNLILKEKRTKISASDFFFTINLLDQHKQATMKQR